MSLLRRIFGSGGFEDERKRADAFYEREHWGEAKLAYERAVDAGTEQPEDTLRMLRSRADACCDRIGEGRVVEAKRLMEMGQLDLAVSELKGALEIAVAQAVQVDAQSILDSIERSDARHRAEQVAVTDEERLAAIAGTWTEEQDQEYAELGDELTDALIALAAGRGDEALPELERLLEAADEPRYLYFELGQARVLAEDDAGAETDLRTFLSLIGPEEGGEARLAAHMELARMAEERENVDAAVEELERAAAALDNDPRPLLQMGRYLRTKGRPAEALEVLELAAQLLDGQPHWSAMQEIGLSLADLGRDAEAIEALEGVVGVFTAQHQTDLPPASATRLAALQEKAGRPERAADLYRTLSQGSDVGQHLRYHREGARLLREIGLPEEARRMLQRAHALASDDQDRDEIDQEIKEFGE